MPKNADEQFLDESLGNVLAEEDEVQASETEETIEEVKLTKEEIEAVEKETGKKLTKEEIVDLEKEKQKVEKKEIPEDLEFIKPEDLPKELQPHFKRMLASYTKKMQGIGDVTKKAELWDYFQQNPQFFADRFAPAPEKVVRREGEEKNLLNCSCNNSICQKKMNLLQLSNILQKRYLILKKEWLKKTKL